MTDGSTQFCGSIGCNGGGAAFALAAAATAATTAANATRILFTGCLPFPQRPTGISCPSEGPNPSPGRDSTPAEAGRLHRDRERAALEACVGLGVVERAGGDVVRRVAVEERGAVLDVPAAGTELELA